MLLFQPRILYVFERCHDDLHTVNLCITIDLAKGALQRNAITSDDNRAELHRELSRTGKSYPAITER